MAGGSVEEEEEQVQIFGAVNNNLFSVKIFFTTDGQKSYFKVCLSDVDMWESTSLLKSQCPIEASGTNIARFYKTGRPHL